MPLPRLLALFALLPLAAAHAASYRWVDENGNTIYSQSPPPAGVQASEIKPPPPPPQPVEGTLTPTKEKAGEAEKPKDKKGTDAKGKENEELRQKNCEAAKKNLGIVENSRFKSIRAPDGTTQKLDEETRAAMKKEAENDVKEYCGKGK